MRSAVLRSFLLVCISSSLSLCLAQTTLSLSSGSVASGGSISLNLSLASSGTKPSGLQWSLNYPTNEITGVTVAAGPAATAAGKSILCSGTQCLLYGVNTQSIQNGVAAVLTFKLASNASGNLAVQLNTAVAASATGSSLTVGTGNGVISVTSVGVAVSPSAVSLGASQTQQFTATVTNSSNTSVTWTRSPAIGTISSSGLYTAPSSVTSQQTVTLTATSVADTSKTATATVTITPAVAVSVTPTTATLGPGKTQQFAATVVNASNTSVTWARSPAIGTISSSGLYTAPTGVTSQQTVTITTTSVADTSKTATATVTVTPTVAVSITPTTATLAPGGTRQFTASVANASNTSVTWSRSPAIGTISSSGLYTAPISVTNQQTVTITATSVADASKTATAIVTITPAVAISVSPATATLGPGGAQQFTATVTNVSNTSVTWTRSPAVGTISSSGLYTAPASVTIQQTVTVTATSVADTTKSATVSILLQPGVVVAATSVWNSTAKPALADAGDSSAVEVGMKFRSDVAGVVTGVRFYKASTNTGTHTGHLWANTGTLLGSVTFTTETASGWQQASFATPVSINANTTYIVSYYALNGHYSDDIGGFTTGVDNPPLHALAAGVDGPNGVYRYGSTSGYPNISWKSSNYWVDVVFLPGTAPVSVAVSPTTATLAAGGTQQFTATVSNASNTSVTWTRSPAVGTISSSGLYTAPTSVTSQQTVTITATSVADTSKTATATVTITPGVAVSVTPTTATLAPGGTQQFTATVANASNTSVTWSRSPAVGTISSSGLYTAPTNVTSQQTVTITATSVADTSKTDTAIVTITPAVGISITPTTATLGSGGTQQFTATVANASNTSVTWTRSPAVGTISSSGLFTAPTSVTSQQTVTITATSVADTSKTATATVTITPAVAVSVTPTTATLAPGGTQQFTATVANASNTSVTWTRSPAVGTISSSGLYSAPTSVTGQQTVTITATSVADTSKTATATVTITPAVAVSVTPTTATLAPGGTRQFTATVVNASNTSVTWTRSPAVGTISSSGLYTAPTNVTSQQTVTITATSVADASKTATVTVTITPAVAVSVSPTTATLAAGKTQQFTATVANASNTSVTWTRSPAIGTINSSGLYAAPTSVTAQQTVIITATSIADPTKYATATITITPASAVSVAITPATVTLHAHGTQQFIATVSNASNTGVTWTLSSATGSITSAGLYTAPSSVTTVQTVIVTATSVADPSKSATSTITLYPAFGF